MKKINYNLIVWIHNNGMCLILLHNKENNTRLDSVYDVWNV